MFQENKLCVRVMGEKYSFLGKFDMFCFLERPVFRFTLFPYYQQNNIEKMLVSKHQEIMVCCIDVSIILYFWFNHVFLKLELNFFAII